MGEVCVVRNVVGASSWTHGAHLDKRDAVKIGKQSFGAPLLPVMDKVVNGVL